MAINSIPIPTDTVRIEQWQIEVYKDRRELWCYSPSGKVFIVRKSTYEFRSLPKYVLLKLHKSGLLQFWKEAQTEEAITRLTTALNNYEAFLTQKQVVVIEEP